ncbi:MAG: beta-propeller domain-containing protein [Bdellovibrionota bacterium]
MKFLLTGLCLPFLLNAVSAQTGNPDLPSREILTKKYLEEISLRKEGQSRFAKKKYSQQPQQQQQQQQQESQDSGSRGIQEADVFKIGKEGKKELFLLNNYRGFQVVSFEDGLDQPKLKGRLPIFNNWSSEMYYLQNSDRVVILNTEWSNGNYGQGSYTTGIYLIDVSDSAAPKLIEREYVPGYLSESRFVGDVLYTISSSWNNSRQNATISSILLESGSLKKIDQMELQTEKEYVQTMNVVQSGGKYSVISTLTSWNGKGDTVNVHDISSPRGDIVKLFSAKARGQIRERSGTFIHRDHLFAVSNYRLNDNSPMRISIEAYPMNSRGDEVNSRENMRLSLGDTNGLHASLQDVRVSGDLLYAFWVPANNIDPFELIDISNPSQGLRHLGQLQFDGWISKAFPIEMGGRKFVVGLGEIVPATREDGKRFPQAKIFEIKNSGQTYRHEVVASLTLESEDVWSNLNGEDKYFEIVEDSAGVFDILFPVYFRKTWSSGGKVVTADLNRATLTEGAAVAGEEGWLRRVFLNREVRSLHAFSDLSLETFRQDDMRGRGYAKAVSVLELARDVVDFYAASASEGIQVIKKTKTTELRRVSLTNSDAELSDVTSTISVKGQYEWHKFQDGKAFLITTFTKKTRYREDSSYEYDIFDYANFTVVDLASGNISTERIQTSVPEGDNRYYYYFELQTIESPEGDILKLNNEFFRHVGNHLQPLEVEESCQYFFDRKSQSFSLEKVGSEIYAFTTFDVKASDAETEEYELPFTKKISFNGAKVSCSASVNVPGKPVFKSNDLLVTADLSSYWYYRGPIHYEYCGESYWPGQSSSKTFSLKFSGPQEATLVDILNKDITNGVYGDGFFTYEPSESRLDLWRISPEGEFLVKPQFLGYDSNNSSLITLKKLGEKTYFFMKTGFKIDLFELGKNRKVTKVSVTSSHDANLEDGSAENIFSIGSLTPSTDGSRIHVSQGMYGVSDIVLK